MCFAFGFVSLNLLPQCVRWEKRPLYGSSHYCGSSSILAIHVAITNGKYLTHGHLGLYGSYLIRLIGMGRTQIESINLHPFVVLLWAWEAVFAGDPVTLARNNIVMCQRVGSPVNPSKVGWTPAKTLACNWTSES